MDQETHENKPIAGSFGWADQGNIENSSKDFNNSNDRIALENPIILNSEKNVGDRGENWNLRVGDQDASGGKGICEPTGEGTSGNSSNLVNEIILERIIVFNSAEIGSINGETKTDESVPNSGVTDQETCAGRGNGEQLSKLEQESIPNSGISSHGVGLETVILVNSEENQSIRRGNQQLEIKGSELGPSKVNVEKSKTNVPKGEKQSCVIDVRCGTGGGGFKDCDGDRVCRICHLSSEGLAETRATSSSIELIHLGCGCKDELGIAHAYCAEAWFKLKGNRMCEICGDMANNITGVGDNRFMEEWNQRRFNNSSSSSSDADTGCWRGQPFCNFVMACLVVAFVLPWFLRIDIF